MRFPPEIPLASNSYVKNFLLTNARDPSPQSLSPQEAPEEQKTIYSSCTLYLWKKMYKLEHWHS